jgi:CelD/BcsL family acetyltransferase involved in cellulose biosynthesis
MQNRIALEPGGSAQAISPGPGARASPPSTGAAVAAASASDAAAVALPLRRGHPESAAALQAWRHAAAGASPLVAAELALLTIRLLPAALEPWLVAAHQGGTLVAALPLARNGRTLLALRTDHTPRVDLVGDETCLPALWNGIRSLRGWDRLELRGVPADSPVARRLPELARRQGYRGYVRDVGRSPWFDVRGIEHRIHRKFRGDMRRLERQLGGVELERIATFDRGAFRDLLRLEACGWKGEAGSAIGCDAKLVAFYSAVGRVFARRGQLTLAFLRARGKRIAGCFALEDGSTFHLLKIAYDEEFAHFGPGQLLVRETAADAERRGLSTYDMMGREAPYKMKWADQARAHVEVVLYAPTLRGRALHLAHERARPLAREVFLCSKPR